MFSIAKFLDSAKAKHKIDSDYGLAKLIGITPQSISQYRNSKQLPDERVITKLCVLSGDDAAMVLERESIALRSRIARLETIGDFGAANGPAWHVR